MKLQKPALSPLLAFIAIQCCWIAVVVFWIYWFLGSHQKFRLAAEKYGHELFSPGINWFILLEGLLLLLVILAGVYVIFLYWRRQLALNREQRVRVTVYDVLGRTIAELADEKMDAGYHILQWDGKTDGGLDCASGIYLCRIRTAGKARTIKMVKLQ